MTGRQLNQLNDAIKAGAEWYRDTAMGASRRQNPLMATQSEGQVWLTFVQRDGLHRRCKLESCLLVADSDAGRFVATLLK